MSKGIIIIGNAIYLPIESASTTRGVVQKYISSSISGYTTLDHIMTLEEIKAYHGVTSSNEHSKIAIAEDFRDLAGVWAKA